MLNLMMTMIKDMLEILQNALVRSLLLRQIGAPPSALGARLAHAPRRLQARDRGFVLQLQLHREGCSAAVGADMIITCCMLHSYI